MIKSVLAKPSIRQFIKFGIIGTFNTLFDFAILNILHAIFNLNLILANSSSFFIATTSAYLLNRYWTFRYVSNESHFKKLFQYAIISAVGLGLSDLILYILAGKFGLYYNLAKLITVLIVLPWNYFGNKHWTFKSQGNFLDSDSQTNVDISKKSG